MSIHTEMQYVGYNHLVPVGIEEYVWQVLVYIFGHPQKET